jgi:hypothetical protein
MRLSLGRRIASALKAASSELDLSFDRPDDRRRLHLVAAGSGKQRPHHQFLHCLVAGEGIAVGLCQPLQMFRWEVGFDDDRR